MPVSSASSMLIDGESVAPLLRGHDGPAYAGGGACGLARAPGSLVNGLLEVV